MAESLFDHTARIDDHRSIADALKAVARSSRMPAGEQLRFESMLDQMSGERTRKDPLPRPRPDKWSD